MEIYFLDLESNVQDRFDMEKFLKFENDCHIMTNSFFLEKIKTLPKRGEFKVTFERESPDLISYKLLNDTQYWWLLMEYNNIKTFRDIKSGLLLNYFSIDELESLYYTLKTEEVKLSIEATAQEQITQENNNNGLTDIGSNTNQRIYNIISLSEVLLNHTMNKRPVPKFVVLDESDNEIEEDITFYYPAGNENKQIFINFGSLKTGKVILN